MSAELEVISNDTIELDVSPLAAAIVEAINWGDIGGTLSNQTDLQNALNTKVDKETGKSLVSNSDILQITTNKNDISSIKNGTTINNFSGVEEALGDKVDKETGKSLVSNNDITQITTNKNDISGIKNGTNINNFSQTESALDTKDSIRYCVVEVSNSGWTQTTIEEETCYQKTINVEGMIQGKHPIVANILTKPSTMENEMKSYSKLFRAKTGNGVITLYSTDIPENSYTIQIKNY